MYFYSILGKKTHFSSKVISLAENYHEKHVSNKAGGVWMLLSKVIPYLLRLAAPLMDSLIVHGNDSVSTELLEQLSFLVLSKLYFFNLSTENYYEKHVSNKTGGVVYYKWMLPSKVMSHLF